MADLQDLHQIELKMKQVQLIDHHHHLLLKVEIQSKYCYCQILFPLNHLKHQLISIGFGSHMNLNSLHPLNEVSN